MSSFFKFYFLFIVLLFEGCQDKAIVNIYDKSTASSEIKCINLVVFPPNEEMTKAFSTLYDFNTSCPIKLEFSKKSSIVCNSNQNFQKKALSNFPSSYLRMRLSKGTKVFYEYYIDLDHEVGTQDITRAFNRIKDDLNL